MVGYPNFLYYIFALLYVYMSLEKNKKTSIRTSIILLFSAHTSQKTDVSEDGKEMFSPKNARQWFLIHYNAMFSHT